MTARPIMHLEIPTPDMATTAQFYATLFGWTPTSHPNAYTTFQTGNLSGGYPDLVRGFRPVIDHLPAAGAVFYVPSQDLETDLAQVTTLGGQVLLGRTAVDAAHWVAVCADPHGTRFVLVTTVAAPRETAPISAAS